MDEITITARFLFMREPEGNGGRSHGNGSRKLQSVEKEAEACHHTSEKGSKARGRGKVGKRADRRAGLGVRTILGGSKEGFLQRKGEKNAINLQLPREKVKEGRGNHIAGGGDDERTLKEGGEGWLCTPQRKETERRKKRGS